MNPLVLLMVKYLMPALAWSISALIPGRKSAIALQEANDKAEIMELVNDVETVLRKEGGSESGEPDAQPVLQKLVAKCYERRAFYALFAAEGAGFYYAESFAERGLPQDRILNDPKVDSVPDKAWLMLHAGMALSFGKRSLAGLKPSSPQLEAAVDNFVQLCHRSSRSGYEGAALEQFGVVIIMLHSAEMARQVAQFLAKHGSDVVEYLWRGVGRGLYFHPLNFIPGLRKPWRAIDLAQQIAPSPTALKNIRAGLAWALYQVNMEHPEIMETALTYEENDPHRDAFINGLMSGAIMKEDTTPGDPVHQKFIRHRPSDPALAKLWMEYLTEPCSLAIQEIYPALRANRRLEEIFRYQDLSRLAGQIEVFNLHRS